MLRISVRTFSRSREVSLQAFAGRLVVADEEPLHVGIAQDDAAQGRSGVGLGPAQAPGVGRLDGGRDDQRSGPFDDLGKPRGHRDRKVGQDASLELEVAHPDRPGVGPEPVRSTGVVGLEDGRWQVERAIEVSPAEECMVGVEAGVIEQPLHGRSVLGVGAPQLPARLLDVVKPSRAATRRRSPRGREVVRPPRARSSGHGSASHVAGVPGGRGGEEDHEDQGRGGEDDPRLETSGQPCTTVPETATSAGWTAAGDPSG